MRTVRNFLLAIPLLCCAILSAQPRVTIPWSNSLHQDFGYGSSNFAAPLKNGSTEFNYTKDDCPPAGYYTIAKSLNCLSLQVPQRDAGHFFMYASRMPGDTGYMMLATYSASPTPKILYTDTLHDLCDKTTYLFWAGIMNTSRQTCIYPNFTFQVETLTGQIIQSYQTGNIGGPGDKGTFYPGYYDHIPVPPFPYYGGMLRPGNGIADVVVKIIANPSNADSHCTCNFAIDNILFMPVGPTVSINAPSFAGGWIAGSCIDGAVPVQMQSTIGMGYLDFGNPVTIPAAYADPGYQWQGSIDGGFNWVDLAGQTSSQLNYTINQPPGMYVRLRVSEKADIGNPNCSQLSNILHVRVDSLPADARLSANSPVCTDGDLVLSLQGGASYQITGPNGFNDNSAHPHINEPTLSASGWYHAEIVTFGGCKAKDSVYVKVIGPDLHAGDDTTICYGQTVKLRATGSNSYQWTPASGLSNPFLPNPVAKPLQTTRYQVKTIDGSGCSARAFVTIQIKDSVLQARINGTDIVCAGDQVLFRDSSIGKIAAWHWTFNNGQTSDDANPPAQQFPVVGANKTYSVQLLVTDSAGCTSTNTQIVLAPASCNIAVPNAFTPNGDGIDDWLYPINAYKADPMEFLVYNRYGQLVFKSTSRDSKWDGKRGGQPQEAGVYMWVMRYTDRNTGRKITSRGSAVLIR